MAPERRPLSIALDRLIMADDAGRHSDAGALDVSSSLLSSDDAGHASAIQQQRAAVADASTPASASRLSTTFNFTSRPPGDDPVPSFGSPIAAFTDMSFAQSSMPSSCVLESKGSLPQATPRQPDYFRRGDAVSHNSKRIKVDPATPALDSMDYWIRFDDDGDKMGSFEIDYSKRNDLTDQNGMGPATHTMPGLGSGLYSTAMAPFREEDFIDDTAFDDQVLSDDEEVEAAQPGDRSQESGQLFQSLPPPRPPPAAPPERGASSASPFSWSNRALSGPKLNVAMEETPRVMRRDIWGGLPRCMNQVLSPDEQRRLLEIALNSGQMPGSYIPPNGFGIGFGAGLGARLPSHLERKRGDGPLSGAADLAHRNTSPGSSWRLDEARELAAQRQAKRAAATKPGPPKRPPGGMGPDAGKPRSAYRIAHNDVERKYRTNLKVKIAELRDAVPALQLAAPGTDAEGSSGPQSNPKVSKVGSSRCLLSPIERKDGVVVFRFDEKKRETLGNFPSSVREKERLLADDVDQQGTVLTKATEYIQQLEQSNKAIMLEHQQFTRRLQAFETLFNSVSRQQDLMPNHSMTLFDPRGFC